MTRLPCDNPSASKTRKPIRTTDAAVIACAAIVRAAMAAHPKRKIAAIARDLGLSYWKVYRYARGQSKALYAKGR